MDWMDPGPHFFGQIKVFASQNFLPMERAQKGGPPYSWKLDYLSAAKHMLMSEKAKFLVLLDAAEK